MSRVFTDDNFLAWEAYESGGKFGLPDRPKLVFNCISAQEQRARYLVLPGDSADAQGTLQALSDAELRRMLAQSEPLD